jgi:hypothetical protein
MPLNISSPAEIVNPSSSDFHQSAMSSGTLRPRHQQIRFGFDPVPSGLDEEIPDAQQSKLYRIILTLLRRGMEKPPLRLLASLMDRSIRMVQRYLRALEALGKVIITGRKIAYNYNEPNTYAIPNLVGVGGGDIDVTEKKVESLTTSTPPRESPRVAIEAKRKQDEQDRQRMRKAYDDRSAFWAMCKETRLGKASRRVSEACMGVWRGERTPDPTPAQIEAFNQRQAALMAKSKMRWAGVAL